MPSLPIYQELRDQYLTGSTYYDLAREFGCAKSTVFRAVKEGALAAGEWPLQPELDRAERIRRTQNGKCSIELEDSSVLAKEIQVRLDAFPGSRREWCEQQGLRYTTVCDVLRGSKPYISRGLGDRFRMALGTSG